ncbi:hypothetical protein BGZ47_002826, partial [Haplosporangium gracile]
FLAVVTLAAPLAKTAPHAKTFNVDTECNGKPCNYPEEIVPYSSEEVSGPFCIPTGNDRIICNYLPQDADLVSESEFDRIFPKSSNSTSGSPKPPMPVASSEGSGPEPSQASQVSSTSKGSVPQPSQPSQTSQVSAASERSVPQPSQTSQISAASERSVPQPSQTSQLFSVSKRSIPKPSQASHPRLASNGTLLKHAEPLSKLEKRSWFALDESSDHWVWPSNTKITYAIAFEDRLKSKSNDVHAAVFDGIDYWKSQCGNQAEVFFDNWYYVNEKKANIWFYFVDGVVCKQPAAFACAFFPQQYPGERTTVFVNYRKLSRMGSAAIRRIMAHEIGHVLGLAHENVDRDSNGDWLKLWKVSDYDDESLMHTFYSPTQKLTKTDCRTMSFYNQKFQKIECGFVDGKGKKCKNLQRTVLKLKDVELNKNEVLVDTETGRDELLEDVADYTCLGDDTSRYILNEPFPGQNNYGYFKRGVALSQCLGVRVPSDPDHIYVLQSDGNFVSYNTKTRQSVWSTQSHGRGNAGDYSLFFQADGNLVIYDKNGVATWSSDSFHGSPHASRIKVDYWQFHGGHMYLTDSSGRSSWATQNTEIHQKVPIQQKDRDGGATGYCMDIYLEVNLTFLNMCNGSDKQLWNIYTDGTIRNKHRGLCLDASNTVNEHRVAVSPCVEHGKDERYLWDVRRDGSIMNRLSKKCLDNRAQQLKVGNVIQIYDCFE